MYTRIGLAIVAAAIAFAGEASARDRIEIVGSSTMLPYAKAVAERFAAGTASPEPAIAATGTTAGLSRFCAGIGMGYPDIATTSRRIAAEEWRECNRNGVTDIIEVNIGFDGIVIGNAKDGPSFELTRGALYEALGRDVIRYGRLAPNTYTAWNEIDPAFPAQPIRVIGPSQGTAMRIAFEELALRHGARQASVSPEADIAIRADGAYAPAALDDAAMVDALEADRSSVGIFGYSVLTRDGTPVKPAMIEGVVPNAATIASGEYPISRPLYVYVKKAHIGTVPGIESYVAELMSDGASGTSGYLLDLGLVPLSAAERTLAIGVIENLSVMTGEETLY